MLGAVGDMVQEKGSRDSRAPQQLDCVARTMHVHQCDVFLKEKSVMCDVFDNV